MDRYKKIKRIRQQKETDIKWAIKKFKEKQKNNKRDLRNEKRKKLAE